ncbi:MAG: hypothetical protein ABEK01_02205 [Candidatus Nanohaloarchaea archaeon]
MNEDLFVKAISVMTVVAVLVGLFGWVGKGIPSKKEAAFDKKLANDAIPPGGTALSWIGWWSLMSIVVGGFLSFGFFWEKPLWPERAVMIPATGFIVTSFTFSVLKVLQITKVANIINTMNFYASLAAWSLLGLAAHFLGGDSEWL